MVPSRRRRRAEVVKRLAVVELVVRVLQTNRVLWTLTIDGARVVARTVRIGCGAD